MLTDEQIREILALEEKATKGPLTYDGVSLGDKVLPSGRVSVLGAIVATMGPDDAMFHIKARNHIAELCREVLALRAAARMALDYCECRNPAVPASPSAAEVRKALRDCLEVL